MLGSARYGAVVPNRRRCGLMRIKLHNLIFLGMVGGLAIGLWLWWVKKRAVEADSPEPAFVAHVLWWLDLFGPTVFMGALKMIIAPLILASIVAGVTSLPNMRELGAIGWKTLVYYLCTTTIAVILGLIFVLTIQPGKKAAAQELRARRVAELDQRRQAYQEKSGRSALADDGQPHTEYLVWLAAEEGAAQAGGHEARRFSKLAGA